MNTEIDYMRRIKELENGHAQVIAKVIEERNELRGMCSAIQRIIDGGKTETKHTPGPWKIKQWDSGMPLVEFDALGSYASVCGRNKEANAALIAAAPDLLAIVKQWECWRDDPNAAEMPGIDDCRAAIARAEGKEVAQ